VAEYLILHGAEINAARSDGLTPLSFATYVGAFPPSIWDLRVAPRRKIIALLVHHGARVDTIIEAIASDNIEKTASFLEKNPQLMKDFFNYGTPLHCSAFWGSSKVAAFLLQKGAEIDAGSKLGTLLIVSSAKGNKEMTGLLISRGADVNSREHYNMTPLYVTVVLGNEKVFFPYYDPRSRKYFAFPDSGNGVKEDSVEIVKLLAAAGADVNIRPELPISDEKSKKGAYPLQIAVMKDWVEMARVLLSAGAQPIINEKDDIWHYTPLHHAVEQGNKALVALLLAHGADVTIKNDPGKTPLAIAVEKGYMDIAVLLQRHGARE
jgi:ankyrin repeat protein